mmetsp:Transcript_66089/g.158077  ORF Transcript_66089/g.158077 Transcript_66089/m.158077 type:complete len:970 (+) Transcript_66089:62-2971(+)
MSKLDAALEKRGYLVDVSVGTRDYVVLRRGHLRVYEGLQQKHSFPELEIQALYRCEVSLQQGGVLQIQTKVPEATSFVFKADSEAEARVWRDAIQKSVAAELKQADKHVQVLQQGTTAYKYNYSNSKRMRRTFWIEDAGPELCWAKSKSDPKADDVQRVDLKDCVGIVFGPATTTFKRCATLEDPAWCCFSLLFGDRTLDMSVPADYVDQWFLGLQHLLAIRSQKPIPTLTVPSFYFRKVYLKFQEQAHNQSLTTKVLLKQRVAQLPEAGFKLKSSTNGKSGAEADKAEKKKKKDKKGAEEAPSSKEAEKSSSGKSKRSSIKEFDPPDRTSNGEEVTALKEDLKSLVAKLEQELDSRNKQFEAMRPSWGDQIGSTMESAFDGWTKSDTVEWQVEKCNELDREVINLRSAQTANSRTLQSSEKAEKQLKRYFKQLKEVEGQVASMEKELGIAEAGQDSSEKAKQSSSNSKELAEAQTSHLERRYKELQRQLQSAEKGQQLSAVYQEGLKKQNDELSRLDREKSELKAKVDAATKDLQAIEKQRAEHEQRCLSSDGSAKGLLQKLQSMQQQVVSLRAWQQQVKTDADVQMRGISDTFLPLSAQVEKMRGSYDHLVERYRELADERKKLHNLVMELKGNIRVFVRVRPINEKEKASEPSDPTITFAEERKVSVLEETNGRRKWFEFDRAFQPKTSQTEVFEEVKPLATSVLDGYNVCIFAYGQTGSGKTYTMTGTKENPGLNRRVLTELFRVKEDRKLDAEIKITLMITEIYNEAIKDLFCKTSKKLDVKENKDGTNTVPGLTEIEVRDMDHLLECMDTAQANRTTMATDMNEESSRSHSIVQVCSSVRDKKDNKEYIGKINLVDLAGSENVNKSGVEGDGLREAQNINKSLLALGDVVAALVAKSSHVPYRNSLLTKMLKDSLGGDSKTLMIVQCSPAQTNVTETLSSLNFASRARNVELGKAKKNVKEAS